MNRETILAMEAGVELDKLVAEEIMGECYHQYWKGDKDSICCVKCGESRFYHQHSQAYSIDISAAWQVVEEMSIKGYDLLLMEERETSSAGWFASFSPIGRKEPGYTKVKSAPEVICKAALLAKLGGEQK